MAAVYKALSRPSTAKDSTPSTSVPTRIKQRVLILSSRGVTYRHRHLLNDLYSLLPQSRKDAKLDTKTKLYQLNELAELYNCNNVLFFEARKGKDLYIWMSKAPNGPTVKFHLQNCTHQASPAETFALPDLTQSLPSFHHPSAKQFTQYTRCPNYTSQAIASAARAPFSPLIPPSPLLRTSSSSKSFSRKPSPYLKAHAKQNLSSTTSWASLSPMARCGSAVSKFPRPQCRNRTSLQ